MMEKILLHIGKNPSEASALDDKCGLFHSVNTWLLIWGEGRTAQPQQNFVIHALN